MVLSCDGSGDDLKQASGVLIASDGFIATNAHVVEGCRGMTATQIVGTVRRSYNAVLKYYDETHDAAILKIDGDGFEFFGLLSATIHIGERVYAIGNPRGLEQSISEGIVSGIREEDGILWVQHSAAISPGSSGGALISSRGDLLGINSWSLKESQGLNFAVPVSTVASAYSGARAIQGSLTFPRSSVFAAPAPAADVPQKQPSLPRAPPSVTSRPPVRRNPWSPAEQLVRLNVIVSDQSGRRVTSLTQSAFTVLEDGAPQHIKFFEQGDVPVSEGIIIDNSTNVGDKRPKVEAAAFALVRDSNPQDEVFIVNFNDEAYLDKDFTNQVKDLEEGLTRIVSRGGAAMRDAIRMSIDHLKEKAKRNERVLVVLTDGNDNSSLISVENLIKSAQDAGVSINILGLLNEGDRHEAARCKRALEGLASSTGGESYFPKGLAEADRAAHQLAHNIRDRYTIVYAPANKTTDGSFRRITITVKGPARPVAKTSQGYYATNDGQ